ncbi:MAG TPA: UvrD-helicase domain-containing protein [Acidimicrobiales bacterium]|nr:UvrD-helicase domain-containing protein [Acidimicrobiales bacterium]
MKTAEPMVPFDVCGPLPGPGVTVLEASAGTGKTFTIAALTARLVADGTPLEHILAVTFTRMATGELRDRVRGRLLSAEEGLARFLLTGEEPADDDVLRLLAQGSIDVVETRRRRLADALAVFDAATITTTHGFCQLVLAGLGVCGEVAAGATLLEDPRDLVDEVVDDLFVRGVLQWGGLPFGRKDAQRIGRQAFANPDTPLDPDPELDRSDLRGRLARRTREEVARRLLDANLLTYDDLLGRLARTLSDAERGEAACARLRQRYRVVLVDEFQDTDPIQWQVVRQAFGTGDTTLVLIGDPKQAVYAFRGADVYAYLEAARQADRRFTLSDNWRSDESLLAAYDVLLNPLRLGHPDIPYRKVTATATHHKPGLRKAPVNTALRARVLHSAEHDLPITDAQRLVQKDAALDFVAADLAADVVRLLGSDAQLVRWNGDGSEGGCRTIAPGDVAVLVRTNRQAAIVQGALRALDVPAVVAGTASVFETAAARHWLRLLEALEQPASRPRAAAVALTPFIGMVAEEVAAAGEEVWEDVHSRLHRWADTLRRRGVSTLFRSVTHEGSLPGRVLAAEEGERELTDLSHVAQLLHAEGAAGQLGPPALRAWLARRIEEAGDESTEAEQRSRRLDSDAAAVQVLTVHRAKGLEFPVVYCPYLWDVGRGGGDGPVVFHDPDDENLRKLDVSGRDGPSYRQHAQTHLEEERGEDLRHLYVALTRARHQAVIWWARVSDCHRSPLARILLTRDGEGNVSLGAPRVPKDQEIHDRFVDLAGRAPGSISVERCSGPTGERWRPETSEASANLTLAEFERSLDARWRRTSYSGITAAAHDELVGSEPEEPAITDEPGSEAAAPVAGAAADRSSAADEQRLRAVLSPLGDMAGGAEVGTFVHRLFERIDFAAADLAADIGSALSAEHHRRPAGLQETDILVAGLEAAITTPLGPLAGGARLADVARGDRLDELSFEFPLAGGDRPEGEVLTSDLARLFADHVPAGAPGAESPLAGYAERLADPVLASHLRGYLTGSLDLVFRRRHPGGVQRFFVADYKTNRLTVDGEALSAWHYRPAALDAEMQRLHYPLQALLYSVALHRYLRWRLPGYDPDENIGGVLYLFVRGMVGPTTPLVDGQPCGVFAWRPPIGLLTAVSDLLDGIS